MKVKELKKTKLEFVILLNKFKLLVKFCFKIIILFDVEFEFGLFEELNKLKVEVNINIKL